VSVPTYIPSFADTCILALATDEILRKEGPIDMFVIRFIHNTPKYADNGL
jgi:hypothetical protein